MSHYKKIKGMKNFFVKSFWISILLLIILCICAALTFEFQASMAERIYGIDIDDYAQILVTGLTIWKVLIVQFALVPALAMWCISKHIKEDDDSCSGTGCGC